MPGTAGKGTGWGLVLDGDAVCDNFAVVMSSAAQKLWSNIFCSRRTVNGEIFSEGNRGSWEGPLLWNSSRFAYGASPFGTSLVELVKLKSSIVTRDWCRRTKSSAYRQLYYIEKWVKYSSRVSIMENASTEHLNFCQSRKSFLYCN